MAFFRFPVPDINTKRRIFNIHTSRMTLNQDVDVEDLIQSKDDLSGADIKAMCTEAGLLALRERRMKVTADDFKKSKEKIMYTKSQVSRRKARISLSLTVFLLRVYPRVSTCKNEKTKINNNWDLVFLFAEKICLTNHRLPREQALIGPALGACFKRL